jgi:NitT/TauT family transport system permease protein
MSAVEISETVDTVSDDLVEAPLVVEESRRRVGPLDVIGPLVVLALFVSFWYFMHHWGLEHLFDRQGFLMPPWHEILYDSFIRRVPQPGGGSITPRDGLIHALLETTKLTFVGLSIAIVLGMFLAFVMTPARWLERSIWPYLVALQAVPILVISPVLGAVFDYTFRTRVIVCVIISIVPIISNTLFGLRSVDQGQHDLFTLQGASWWTRLTKLQIPSALPAIFTGFRISSGLAVIGAVVGELFNRKGTKGIGILMDEYRSRNQFTYTYGALLMSSLLGIAVFFFFGWLQKLATGKWHESAQAT